MPARSKIAVLPEDVRAELDRRLIANGFGGLADLSEWLSSQGFAISKTSVQRHSSLLERRIEQVRQATLASEALVEAVGDEQGSMADASLRLIQSKIHDLMMAAEDDDLKSLAAAARALADVARASVSVQRERRKVLREAAAKANRVARRAGISGDTAAAIRAAIEGTAE